MGGYGSGCWRAAQYELAENCLSVTPRHALGAARAASPLLPAFIDLGLSGRHYAPDAVQRVRLQSTPCRYGGVRWWFECPRCGRRVGKLYLPPRAVAYRCRLCWDLRYRSQRLANWDRRRWRADKLWARITPRGEDRPRRPKWMHRTTYRRLWQAADDVDREGLAILCGTFIARTRR